MADQEDSLIAIPRINPVNFHTYVNQYFNNYGSDADSRQAALEFLALIAADETIRDLFYQFLLPLIYAAATDRKLSQFQYVHDISDVINNRQTPEAGTIPDGDIEQDLIVENNDQYFSEPVMVVGFYDAPTSILKLSVNLTGIGAYPAADQTIIYDSTPVITVFHHIVIPAFERLILESGA